MNKKRMLLITTFVVSALIINSDVKASFLNTLSKQVSNVANSAAANAKNQISNVKSSASSMAANAKNQATNVVASAQNQAASMATNVQNQATNVVTNATQNVAQQVNHVAQGAQNMAQGMQGIVQQGLSPQAISLVSQQNIVPFLVQLQSTLLALLQQVQGLISNIQ